MMKLKKRVLLGMSVLLVGVTALSGCSKGVEKNASTSVAPSAYGQRTADRDPMSKPLELSVAVWDIQTGFDDPNAKNDTVYNDLAKKFNITIKPVQITWNDWQEKAKVWAASKQLPDMFADEVY